MRFFPALLALAAAQPDPFAVLRSRSRQLFYSTAAAPEASSFLAKLNGSCFWPDINYHDQTRANWAAITHVDRLLTMVQALTTPGSPSFESAALTTGTHCALGAWIYRQPRFTNPK